MFNAILRALIQSYLLQSIKMWKTLRYYDFDSGQSITEFSFAIILGLVLLSYPIWIKIFLTIKETSLGSPQFKAKYDSVYQNLDYYKV